MLARLVENHPATLNCLSWHVDQVCKAFAEKRLELYFDVYGRWVGSLYWKRLGGRGEAAVLAGAEPVDVPEMAGGKPWIVFFEARRTKLLVLLRHAAVAGPLSFIDHIAYARVRQGQRVIKRSCLPARAGSVVVPPGSEEGFLAKDRGGKQRCEALEMLSKARRLGEWALLSNVSPKSGRLGLVNFVNAVTVPLLLGQYLEVRASGGHLEAFLAYGLLTEDGLARFRLQGPNALCPACYSEGDVVTAICAGATPSHAAQSALAAQATALRRGRRRELNGTGVITLDYV